MGPKYVFKKSVTIQTPTRAEWHEHKGSLQNFTGPIWYMNGSKMEAATAAFVYGENPKVKFMFSLGKLAYFVNVVRLMFPSLQLAKNVLRSKSPQELYTIFFAGLDDYETDPQTGHGKRHGIFPNEVLSPEGEGP